MATVRCGLRAFFLTYLLVVSAPLESKKVIFDFGGVLGETSTFGIMKELNCLPLFVELTFIDWRLPTDIMGRFFNLLTALFGEQRPVEGSTEGSSLYAMGNGKKLPQVMCDWLRGIYTGPEIAARVCACLDGESVPSTYSSCERKLFKKIAWTMFNPVVMCKHTHPLAQGIELLKDCLAAGNDVLLLSNFAPEDFIGIYNKDEFRDLFTLIPPENIVVSGFIGMIKPEGAIFDYLINAHQLATADCVFIDDQEENCEAATSKGITSLRFEKGKVKKIRRTLAEWGVLPA